MSLKFSVNAIHPSVKHQCESLTLTSLDADRMPQVV